MNKDFIIHISDELKHNKDVDLEYQINETQYKVKFLATDDDNEVKVGEKRIYAPNIVSIIDGSTKELTTGLSDKQTDGYMTLTDEMKQESYKKIKKVVQEVVNHNNTCDLDKGC